MCVRTRRRTATTYRLRDGKILIQEVSITGTRTLDNPELNEITNSLTAIRANDNAEEIRERVRDSFQQRDVLTRM